VAIRRKVEIEANPGKVVSDYAVALVSKDSPTALLSGTGGIFDDTAAQQSGADEARMSEG
jgi:hypothetical protein